ncbi:MAG: DUF2782 domain-containing protein [Pseudoxanthomonas sp.]
MNLKPLVFIPLLMLAACASTQTADDGAPPVDLAGTEVFSHTAENGDVIEEYRAGAELRMVKITPARGPAYYLYDRNGDGKLDAENKQMPQTYWKLFSW